MLNARSGTAGRDVIFTLKTVVDPSNKQVMKQFGNELANVEKQATVVVVQETNKRTEVKKKAVQLEAATLAAQVRKNAAAMQKEIDQEIGLKQKRDKIIANNWLKTELKRIDDAKRQENEFAKWRERVRANSAVLEQRENIRIARERAAAEKQSTVSRERAAAARHVGYGQVFSGIGNVARGAAYSGLIGEGNSQHILNTVLGVEAASSVGSGASNFVKGAGAVTGLGLGAGGATVAGGAAIAALVAWLPALASAVRGAAVAIKGSDITKRGDIGGGMGEGIARTYSGFFGMFGTKFLRNKTRNDSYFAPYTSAALSDRSLSEQQKAAAARNGALAEQAGLLGDLGSMQRNRTRHSLAGSQDTLRSDIQRFREMTGRGENNAATQAAYENVRQSMEQVRQLSVDAARNQIEGSRQQLENLKQSHNEAKQIADEAKRSYESDVLTLATAKPEELMRIREIDRKRRSGEDLNRNELEYAGRFNEFRDFAKEQAQKRVAEKLGLGDVLREGREKARTTAERQAEIAKQVVQTELTVKQQHEVILKLEGGEFAESIAKAIGDASIPDQLNAYQERIEKVIDDKIAAGLRKMRNGTLAN